MRRNVVGKLPLKVIVSNAENVQVFLLGIYLNVEWIICFQKGICLVSVLTECSVSNSIFMLMVLRLISNRLLNLKKNSFEHTSTIE